MPARCRARGCCTHRPPQLTAAVRLSRRSRSYEQPLNVYGYSKLLFDNIVRRALPALQSQVVGFRYFNVYGPREQHKGRMASVAFHHFNQFRARGKVDAVRRARRLCGRARQSRDFVSVDDVVAVNLWFLQHPRVSGIFNLGTGRAQPFNDVAAGRLSTAAAVLAGHSALTLQQQLDRAWSTTSRSRRLGGKYQSYTQADLQTCAPQDAMCRSSMLRPVLHAMSTGWAPTMSLTGIIPRSAHGSSTRSDGSDRSCLPTGYSMSCIAGHVMYLERARELGATLLVGCQYRQFGTPSGEGS